MKTIKISEQAWALLMKLKTELSLREKRAVSIAEVLDRVLACYAIKCLEERS
jgi:hypothetical protein